MNNSIPDSNKSDEKDDSCQWESDHSLKYFQRVIICDKDSTVHSSRIVACSSFEQVPESLLFLAYLYYCDYFLFSKYLDYVYDLLIPGRTFISTVIASERMRILFIRKELFEYKKIFRYYGGQRGEERRCVVAHRRLMSTSYYRVLITSNGCLDFTSCFHVRRE